MGALFSQYIKNFCSLKAHPGIFTKKLLTGKKNKTANGISAVFCAHIHFCAGSHLQGLRSDSQALAALCTASIDDLTAVLGAHAGQKAMNFLALTLLGLKSSLHGCILRKNLSPVWGLDRSQIGDRLAIQQYIA